MKYWLLVVAVVVILIFGVTIAGLAHLSVPLKWADSVASPYKEGVQLWVAISAILTALFTVALALATFVLARFTFESVRTANALSQGEDRRHQQNLGPILTIEPIREDNEFTGFTIRNVGLGPAQNILFMMKGRCSILIHRDLVSWQAVTAGSLPVTETTTREFTVELFLTRTILEPRPETVWPVMLRDHRHIFERDALSYDTAQLVAVMSYYDLSGNEYRTFTQDPLESSEMAWFRPKFLYPQRTNIERYLEDKVGEHAAPDVLLDYLTSTRPVATTG